MSTVTRRALTAWRLDHGLTELGGKATSRRRFRPSAFAPRQLAPRLLAHRRSSRHHVTVLGVVQQWVQSDLTWLRLAPRWSQLAIASDAEPSSSLLSLRRHFAWAGRHCRRSRRAATRPSGSRVAESVRKRKSRRRDSGPRDCPCFVVGEVLGEPTHPWRV